MFKDDLHNVGMLSTRMEEMDALRLIYLLRNFIMEIAKKDGYSYTLKIVYGIVCAGCPTLS